MVTIAIEVTISRTFQWTPCSKSCARFRGVRSPVWVSGKCYSTSTFNGAMVNGMVDNSPYLRYCPGLNGELGWEEVTDRIEEAQR